METIATPRKPRLPDPTAIVAALMTMMTRFSCLGCSRLAGRIRRNLALLQHYADDDMPPALKSLAQKLEREWAQLQFAISDTADGLADEVATPRAESTESITEFSAYPTASQSLH
jgi:hypothetical protein